MNKEFPRFKELLKTRGYFVTKPRLRLFALLQQHNTLGINELIARLPHQDQATVYRNIKLFEELGIINRLQLGWHSKLELSDRFEHHHHHISCTKCGKVWVLKEDPAIEKHIADISQKSGFLALDHQLEIRGLCQACQSVQTNSAS